MSRHQRLIRLLITILLAGSSSVSLVAAADPFRAMLLGKWDGYDGTHADVWADGDYAYMGTFTLEDYQAARIHVLDISDPMAPSLATTFFLPPPNDLTSPQDIKVADGLLFVALEYSPSDDGVAIIDVRDPTNPSLLATVAIEGFSSIHNLFYADGFLYLADGDDPEIAIVDLRDFDPDNPPESPITEYYWLVTNVGSSFVHDITVTGGYLYASAWNSGIKILGIENVADLPPHVLGEADGDNVHSAWPTDDGRFVVVAEEREDGGITVFEVTENGGLLTLTLRDAYSIPNISTHNVVVVGYRAYCSWYEAGLQVFDLDPDTGELSLRANYDTSTEYKPGFNGAWGVYPFLGPERVLVATRRKDSMSSPHGPTTARLLTTAT